MDGCLSRRWIVFLKKKGSLNNRGMWGFDNKTTGQLVIIFYETFAVLKLLFP
jgi:hypothetical protein